MCNARIITVAKSGGDLTTIMAGLNTAEPGDTVAVKSGIYSEIIKWPKSGTADGGYITLKSFGDGPAIIDGAPFTVGSDNAELILISDKHYIAIIGMEIRNSITSSDAVFNKGIQIEGNSNHILVKKCKIYKIENNSPNEGAGANAIGIFGRLKNAPISSIIIDSCEIFDNKTCWSEAVSIDGNVDGFRITNNHIHDNNNIGILIAGYYGECENCGVSDQARHGVISDNRVERCSSCNNPAYKGDCSAGGIYSDGGGKTVVERNIVTECDIGIEAGAELSSSVDDSMIIRDNIIMKNKIGGIYVGGYETNLGWTTFCSILNNTLYMNDTKNSGSGELLIQKAHDIVVKNNVFYATNQKMSIAVTFNTMYAYNNKIENNLFFSSSGASGIEGTELDLKAKKADPLFVSNGTDFHLQSTSPAINACDPSYMPFSGELDFDKLARKSGSAVDIGAYESIASPVINNSVNIKKISYSHRLKISVAGNLSTKICVEYSNARSVVLNGKSLLFQR